MNALKYEVKMGRLARKVSKWFDETQGKKGDMQYRFTGKESRMFCHNYARLLTTATATGTSLNEKVN